MSSMFERWRRTTTTYDQGRGSCFRKGAYRTVEIADAYRRKSEARQPGLVLYIYQCPVCRKYHLTKQKQAKEINVSRMSSRRAESMALGFCMQGVARYLDCLNGVVNVYEKDLPPEFVAEVRKDFASYAEKMTAAGLPFQTITSFGNPDVQE